MGQIKKCERAIKQTLSRQCVSKVERTNTKEVKAAKNGHVSGWIFQHINSTYIQNIFRSKGVWLNIIFDAIVNIKSYLDKILAFAHAKSNYSRFVSLLICKVRKRKLWFATLPKSYLTLLQFSVVSLHFLGEELLGICQVVFARGRERERER